MSNDLAAYAPSQYPLDGFQKKSVLAQNIQPGDRLFWRDETGRGTAIYEVTDKRKGRGMFGGGTKYSVSMKRVQASSGIWDDTQTVNYWRKHPLGGGMERYEVYRRPPMTHAGGIELGRIPATAATQAPRHRQVAVRRGRVRLPSRL